MANLKFYKGTETQINAQTVTAGAIWFNTTDKTINVRTSAGAWEKYAGNLKDAAWGDNNKLTITKYDGSSIELDFSDMASATGVAAVIGTFADAAKNDNTASIHARINAAFAAIGTKLEAEDQLVKSVNTAADAGVALALDENGELSVEVTKGAIAKDNGAVVLGGQVYTAIEDVKGQIAGKNVSAEGDTYVSATAADNKVTVAATQDLIDAVDLANSAVQKVTVLGQELENGGELTVAQAKTALGLGSAAYVDTTAFDAAGTGAGSAAAAEAAAKAYVDGIVGDVTGEDGTVTKGLDSRIKDLEAIDHEKLASDASAAAVATILDNSPESFDTLKEVADWIANNDHADDVATLMTDVENLKKIDHDAYKAADTALETSLKGYVDGKDTAMDTRVKVLEGHDVYVKNDVDSAIADAKKAGTDANAALEAYKPVIEQKVEDAKAAAIAKAEQNAKSYADGLKATIDGVIEENEKTTAAALTELDGRVDVLEAKNATIDSALQQADITTGSANGTIAVKGTDVAVAGLGSAAFTESNAYATAAQGQLADSAVQSITVLGEVLEDGGELTVEEAKAALGLKDAAYVTVESLNATAQGYATTAKNEVIGDAANDTKDSKTIEGVKKYVDAQVADGLSWAIFE